MEFPDAGKRACLYWSLPLILGVRDPLSLGLQDCLPLTMDQTLVWLLRGLAYELQADQGPFSVSCSK